MRSLGDRKLLKAFCWTFKTLNSIFWNYQNRRTWRHTCLLVPVFYSDNRPLFRDVFLARGVEHRLNCEVHIIKRLRDMVVWSKMGSSFLEISIVFPSSGTRLHGTVRLKSCTKLQSPSSNVQFASCWTTITSYQRLLLIPARYVLKGDPGNLYRCRCYGM